MLRWRLILGGVLVAGLAVLVWFDNTATPPGIWLMPLALTASFLATQETLDLVGQRLPRPNAAVIYVGNVATVLAVWLPHWTTAPAVAGLSGPLMVFALAAAALLISEVRRFTHPGVSINQASAGAFVLCYAGLLLATLAALRLVAPAWNVVPLLSVIATVKLGDIGAYTVGRLVGRHKMAPVVSPGKTWEGLAGGLVFAVAGAWLALNWFPAWFGVAAVPRFGVFDWLGFGLTVGAAGVAGDLAESLLKRDAGRKDSSRWMPGFGGVLDLLDSLLVAAPVGYAWWGLRLGMGP
ncbi:MAG: phosphatidate cytidylyltransferase [Pirellulales bacterium]